jgi:hypothetical protein
MTLFQTARSVAFALRHDPAAVASLRTEFTRLALEVATSVDGGKEITSATVNGQTFSKSVTMTKADRLKLLEMVLTYVDRGIPTTRTSARFSWQF